MPNSVAEHFYRGLEPKAFGVEMNADLMKIHNIEIARGEPSPAINYRLRRACSAYYLIRLDTADCRTMAVKPIMH